VTETMLMSMFFASLMLPTMQALEKAGRER
jgi:hypothetical protein